jgi:hypothetical protein
MSRQANRPGPVIRKAKVPQTGLADRRSATGEALAWDRVVLTVVIPVYNEIRTVRICSGECARYRSGSR